MITLRAIQDTFLVRTPGADARFNLLHFLDLCLQGRQYDKIPYDFYVTSRPGEEYIPLRKRRPAVVYNLAKVLVDRSTDMLFGDMHWPTISVEGDKDTELICETLIQQSDFKRQWRKAARKGSIGCVAVVFKFWKGRLYHEVLDGKHTRPVFHPVIPGELVSLREQKIVMGRDLASISGIPKLEPDTQYYYRRDFTETEEIEYYPLKLTTETSRLRPEQLPWRINKERSHVHNLGFVPGVWIKNLESDDLVDGASTFIDILGFQVELDYLLSQIGRVFHYTGDPLLVLKDPSLLDTDGTGQQKVRSAGNAVILNEDGDAFNLEIQADAQRVSLEYAEKLRKFALEVGRGNRADPERISSSQSGKALALLHKDLIGLVSELRISYGEAGLVPYLHKILRAAQKLELAYPQLKGKKSNPDTPITLVWGAFFEPTSADDREMAQFLTESITNGTISEERGTVLISDRARITDPAAEREVIKKERDEADKRAMALDQAQQRAQVAKSESLQVKSSAPPEKR